jgi:site-specific DNA-cytosine methylase
MTDAEIAGAKRVARFMKEYANDDAYDGETPVCAAGVPIVDIGMRMLDLRELYRAQGFPDDYIIAPKVWRIVRGKLVYGPLPKTDGTRMCGNSVSPYQARAWILANAPPEIYAPGVDEERRAA